MFYGFLNGMFEGMAYTVQVLSLHSISLEIFDYEFQ